MDGYDATTYGERFADVYDDWYGSITDTEACVAALAALAREAGGGPVLELGVGTGRLAVPLAAVGLAVTGVDSSPAMLARLADKPGGADVRAVLGDMTAPPAAEPTDGGTPAPGYALAFVAYNTLFNLVDPADQLRCLTATAPLLAPGGRLVVEAFVPDVDGAADDAVVPRRVTADHVVLSVSRSDPSRQEVLGQYVDITESGIRLRPWHIRWSTPGQLDEAAAAAGLALDRRWADWDATPFDGDAAAHVSIYRRT